MSSNQRGIFFNSRIASDTPSPVDNKKIRTFHASIPGYEPSPLRNLSRLAEELNVRKVVVKDESNRFGQPSFKILGVSWIIFKAVTTKLNLSEQTNLDSMMKVLQERPTRLIAASDGNLGRAVAFMGNLLGIRTTIFVPKTLEQDVKTAVLGYNSEVEEIDGDYERAVERAEDEAIKSNGILVQFNSWQGCHDYPHWLVEGYSTIFAELIEQLPEMQSRETIIITPVGVGSLAHSVVRNCKSMQPPLKIATVEPTRAACLYESLWSGTNITVETSPTIMTGMEYGTVSPDAFDDLQKHVNLSLTISDFECHLAVKYLDEEKIKAGPCGSACVAAARRLNSEGHLNQDSVVILLNTESQRHYIVPQDHS